MIKFAATLAAAGLIIFAVTYLAKLIKARNDHPQVPLRTLAAVVLQAHVQAIWAWLRRLPAFVAGFLAGAEAPAMAAGAPSPVTAAPLPPPPAAAAPGDAPAPGDGGATTPGTAAQADLLHTIRMLVALASSGDIRDVRRVIGTLAAASQALGGGLSRLGTRLAEPDKHYGPEIWEALVAAGSQARSAALHCGQADAALTSLGRLTVAELASSPRQAPHHSQLNGAS